MLWSFLYELLFMHVSLVLQEHWIICVGWSSAAFFLLSYIMQMTWVMFTLVLPPDSLYYLAALQTSNLKSLHPTILKKSNHILRNYKNVDIGNFMYGIPDLTKPRLSFYEFRKFLFCPQ